MAGAKLSLATCSIEKNGIHDALSWHLNLRRCLWFKCNDDYGYSLASNFVMETTVKQSVCLNCNRRSWLSTGLLVLEVYSW